MSDSDPTPEPEAPAQPAMTPPAAPPSGASPKESSEVTRTFAVNGTVGDASAAAVTIPRQGDRYHEPAPGVSPAAAPTAVKAIVVHPGVTPEALAELVAKLGPGVTVIAIDGAAAEHAADWWLVSKPETFEQLEPHGESVPKLFTTADCLRALRVGPKAAELEEGVQTFEPLWEQFAAKLGWSLYPASAAMVLAASLGAQSVDVLGGLAPGDRLPDCVACERQVLQGVADHLAKAGVVATVPLPPEPPAPPAPVPARRRR